MIIHITNAYYSLAVYIAISLLISVLLIGLSFWSFNSKVDIEKLSATNAGSIPFLKRDISSILNIISLHYSS
jgi:hypothetical protein